MFYINPARMVGAGVFCNESVGKQPAENGLIA